MNRILTTAFTALLLALPAAFAHSVWIEPDANGNLVVRFAEPDGKLEKSPGHLDSLTLPVAVKTGPSNAPVALDTAKQRDHFSLGTASVTDAVQVETAFIVMARGGAPGRKPNFYARWQPEGTWEAAPALTLDLLPTGKRGEVRLLFRGQPMAGKKATLRTPDEKEQELTSDDQGYLRFTPSQAGQYLLTVAHHRENLSGFHGGRAYEQNSHNASLSWRQR